jgi:hypothetical protein
VHSVFKIINRQTFYAGLGKSADLEVLKKKIDVASTDPYFRCASHMMAAFLREDYKGLDADRREAYIQCIQIMEDLARTPGEDLHDHLHLVRYLGEYCDIASSEMEIQGVFTKEADSGKIGKPVLTTAHRIADVSIDSLPRLKDWPVTPDINHARFAYTMAQEARKTLDKIGLREPDLARKALESLDGYFVFLEQDTDPVNMQRLQAKLDWPMIEKISKSQGVRLAHLRRPEKKSP